LAGGGESWKFDKEGHELPTELERYCAQTGLPTELHTAYRVAERTCGPILSRFEAEIVAAMFNDISAPGGDQLDKATSTIDAHTLEPMAKGRDLFEASAGTIDGHVLVTALWATNDESVAQELYAIGPTGYYVVQVTPGRDSFEYSSGLALVSAERLRHPVFLEIVGTSKSPGKKSESLRAWRQDGTERRTLFEIPWLTWSRDESGADLSVSRVSPAPGGLRITSYRVRAKWLPEVKQAKGELLHVDTSGSYGLPLAEIDSIVPAEDRFESIDDLE
jgi:hypothetical protein